MTPPARLQAAAEILDAILAGQPAEQALSAWTRARRFAGSGDRAAIRDHVYDALRRKRSLAHLGGAMTGRGLIIGLAREAGAELSQIFTGAGHAPAALSEAEAMGPSAPMDELVALDCPDWLAPALRDSLGPDFAQVMDALRWRAPLFLRVNLARIGLEDARAALAADGITAVPHPLAPTALEVTENARKVARSAAYGAGLVELQDVSSQAVIAELPELGGARVLDYCAGGGGKALAMAARGAQVSAHDASPARMRDLPARAARAGAAITQLDAPEGLFDLVLTDVPCSGSGSWRRDPEGKWRLAPDRLEALIATQAGILTAAARHVRPGGQLCYVTCSLLDLENQSQIARFLQHDSRFALRHTHRLTPLQGGDGFFLATLSKCP